MEILYMAAAVAPMETSPTDHDTVVAEFFHTVV